MIETEKKFDLKVFRYSERPNTLSFEQKEILRPKEEKRCHLVIIIK